MKEKESSVGAGGDARLEVLVAAKIQSLSLSMNEALEAAKAAARSQVAGKDRELLEERQRMEEALQQEMRRHEEALEAQAERLEEEFCARLAKRQEEFDSWEEGNELGMAQMNAEVERLKGEAVLLAQEGRGSLGETEVQLRSVVAELERMKEELLALTRDQPHHCPPPSEEESQSAEIARLWLRISSMEKQQAKQQTKLQESRNKGEERLRQMHQSAKELQIMCLRVERLSEENRMLRGGDRIGLLSVAQSSSAEVAIASYSRLPALSHKAKRITNPPPISLGAANSSSRNGPSPVTSATVVSSSSTDTKERKFVFIFKGDGIDFGVFGADCKVLQIEVGEYDGEHKYCVMQLHRNYGRRPGNLANIVNEYNAVALAEFKMQLSEERTANGGSTPSLYLFKVGSVNPELLAKVQSDRALAVKPPTYQVWCNPLRRPVVAAAAGGDGGVVSADGGAETEEEEEGDN